MAQFRITEALSANWQNRSVPVGEIALDLGTYGKQWNGPYEHLEANDGAEDFISTIDNIFRCWDLKSTSTFYLRPVSGKHEEVNKTSWLRPGFIFKVQGFNWAEITFIPVGSVINRCQASLPRTLAPARGSLGTTTRFGRLVHRGIWKLKLLCAGKETERAREREPALYNDYHEWMNSDVSYVFVNKSVECIAPHFS